MAEVASRVYTATELVTVQDLILLMSFLTISSSVYFGPITIRKKWPTTASDAGWGKKCTNNELLKLDILQVIYNKYEDELSGVEISLTYPRNVILVS